MTDIIRDLIEPAAQCSPKAVWARGLRDGLELAHKMTKGAYDMLAEAGGYAESMEALDGLMFAFEVAMTSEELAK